MSSIKTAIRRKLLDLGVTATVWDAELPQNPVYPTTAYDLDFEEPVGLCHDSGTSPMRRARFLVAVFAEGGAQADELIEQYFAGLANLFDDLGDGLSPETVYRCAIWWENTNPLIDYEQEPTLKPVRCRSMDFRILYRQQT